MKGRISHILICILLIFAIVNFNMASAHDCAISSTEPERFGMPGGYSSPHQPTSEELALLRKTWSQATSKCSHLPKEMERLKVCSVSKQG